MKWLKKQKNNQVVPSLEQQRAEKLTEMGAQLRALRQERGFSLEEMVMLTKIPKRLLQAIEAGNLNDLPEPVYIHGLIRQFADALGLNGAEFASNFPLNSPKASLQSGWKSISIAQLRPFHLYWLYILVIICSISGLSHLLNNAGLQANNNQIPKPLTESDAKSATQLKQSPKVKPVSSIKADQAVQIGVTLKASSWIRVVADGKTEFEGTLPQGTHRTWKAQEQLTVKTNNAGGVLMSVNQQEPKKMGELGKVEEIKIAAQSRQ
ncbi:MAG: DUF4115 domain-containing protein [Desmonostoc vinosum HA7617-LM4]|jgi:cytoskeletal protein RodZ|nr:DUF4115 domain-containing protein [Desmonostoc vinosum HA7617-LM4]